MCHQLHQHEDVTLRAAREECLPLLPPVPSSGLEVRHEARHALHRHIAGTVWGLVSDGRRRVGAEFRGLAGSGTRPQPDGEVVGWRERLHQSDSRRITRAGGDQECEFGAPRDGESSPQHQLGGQRIIHDPTLPGFGKDG